jgi:hypothetical protein
MNPNHRLADRDAGRFRTPDRSALLLSDQTQVPCSRTVLENLCGSYRHPFYALVCRLLKPHGKRLREEVARTAPESVGEKIHSFCAAMVASEAQPGP